ncbi:MAG: hypothetical protein WCA38_11525 [Candidatus Acidiferrales bacterium]
MTTVAYGKLTAGLIAIWFVFSLVASALHVFATDASRPPLALGLAALTPIVLFVAWCGVSKEFREFVLSLNPRTLTTLQSWRIAGFVFLVLYTYRILPGFFALPAGWGDVFIGATAALVAAKLAGSEHRTGFLLWQALGILDLLTAVTLGTMSGLIAPHGIATSAMTMLPLSLIPTFAVPLLMIFHFICIAQARRWPGPAQLHYEQQLRSSAA